MNITAIKRWENGRVEEAQFFEEQFDEMIVWFRLDPEAGISTFASDPERDEEIYKRVCVEFSGE